MISPKEFAMKWKEVWGEETMKFSADSLEGLALDEEVKQFLIEGGLPKEAPSLDFNTNMMTVSEWHDLEEDLGNYIYIGSTGWGDPICLYVGDDEDNGYIVFLDHEVDFEYETLVNSSIPQLAESLLVYAQLVKEAQKEGDGLTTPKRLIQWMSDELNRIDEAAMEGGFWVAELETLEDE